MVEEKLDTGEKAFQINLDAKKYGTFAEIGAGQEVARWFFHVGKASGTVAKTISAYDMAISDAIYGASDRYVSRKRLQSMLDHEFNLLLQRLDKTRGDKCTFFVFADTVATKARRRPGLARHQISSPSARRSFHHHHPCADARQGKRCASRKRSASSA